MSAHESLVVDDFRRPGGFTAEELQSLRDGDVVDGALHSLADFVDACLHIGIPLDRVKIHDHAWIGVGRNGARRSKKDAARDLVERIKSRADYRLLDELGIE